MKTLIVYKSIHLGSTKKIAQKLAQVLNSDIKEPHEVDLSHIQKYDLIGFGSGIYSSNFHQTILDLVDKITDLKDKRVFIFSTSGVIYERCHSVMKQKLLEKNAVIVDEFFCKGLNKNSFLKYFGGMNKGRPNKEDLERAVVFARKLSTTA